MKNSISRNKDRATRILEAAARLMTRYGYDKTTMEDIAREACVSKGAIYLEWSGREDLFDDLFEHEMKKLILDIRSRIESSVEEINISNLYGITLSAMNSSRLISALYTRDGKILGDFVHRQDPNRYIHRLLMSKESITTLQKSGMLRSDLSADVLAYLFSLMALGVLSISSIIPEENAPPIEKTIDAISAMVQGGLVLPGTHGSILKETTLQMLDLMMSQYEKEEKNEHGFTRIHP